ncbi:MAG: hypothetical protein HY650_04270 [Acidobacteria bacterium]|nr:hypothetical protein [Acidobacteriota bacterium]
MKFLVMWEIDITGLRAETMHAVMRMPEYAKKIRSQGKLVARYHIVGKRPGIRGQRPGIRGRWSVVCD